MKRVEIVEQITQILHKVVPTAEIILLDGEHLSLAREESVTLPLYELEFF